MAYGIIYKATNIVNGKIYIGQTVNSLKERKYGHFKVSRNNIKNKHFASALKKYGTENFIWEEIDEASSKEELDEKEIDWIWLNNSTDRKLGYNKSIGGHSHQKLNIKYALILLYQGYLIKELCEKLNCERSAIIRRLSAYLGKEVYAQKVKENRNNRPKWRKHYLCKEDINNFLAQGYSMSKIGRELKISKSVVFKFIKKEFGLEFYNNLSKQNIDNTINFSIESLQRKSLNKIGDINIIIQRWYSGESLKHIADSLHVDKRQFRDKIISSIGEEEYNRRAYMNSRHRKVI